MPSAHKLMNLLSSLLPCVTVTIVSPTDQKRQVVGEVGLRLWSKYCIPSHAASQPGRNVGMCTLDGHLHHSHALPELPGQLAGPSDPEARLSESCFVGDCVD